jgi:hypothetical protein
MTGGSHLSARGREEAGYRFGFDFLGRGPLAGLGRMASPGSFSIFIFFSSFPFPFFFLVLLYLLQKCFKAIQTTFTNLVEFTARF